ncbi:hypothetical protein AAG604_03090 [Citromicrobium bathyomarinum]
MSTDPLAHLSSGQRDTGAVILQSRQALLARDEEISWKAISSESAAYTTDRKPLSRSLLYLPHYRALWDDERAGGSLQEKGALIRRLRSELRALKAENGKLRDRMEKNEEKLEDTERRLRETALKLEEAQARVQDLLLGYIVKT